MIRACIFDLGGTIVDKYSLSPFLSLKSAFKKHNILIPNALIFKDMGKHKLDHINDILLNDYVSLCWEKNYGNKPCDKSSGKVFSTFNDIQLEASKNIDIIPETNYAIQYLKSNSIRTGCTTGFNFENMMQVQQRLNKNSIYLDSYVSSTCLGKPSRPDPSMIYKNMNNLNIVNSKQVLKIDDTVVGIEEGKNAGCWTVGVAKWSTNMKVKSIEESNSITEKEISDRLFEAHDILKKSGADFVIDDLNELPNIITLINNISHNYREI
tara:strand:- start:12 stop:812 length:801 start_codon:yes stop_codon:yes gene_type:complete